MTRAATTPLDSSAPMEFAEERYPFDNPTWLFEIKFDACRVISSTGPEVR